MRVLVATVCFPPAWKGGGSVRSIGALATENLPHFVTSLAQNAGITVHLDVLKGENDHHRAEAAFKALALALRQAVSTTGSSDVPSTKGYLAGGSR